MQILTIWRILFLFLFASFGVHKIFLFLFVQKLDPQIYSYSYLQEKLLFADHWNINSNQYWIPLSHFHSRPPTKKLYTQKVIPFSDKKVPVNLVVLCGLLLSWRSYTDPTDPNNFMMSSKDLLSFYINIFKAISQQMSYARIELGCKDIKVTVNFNHDLRVNPRQNSW